MKFWLYSTQLFTQHDLTFIGWFKQNKITLTRDKSGIPINIREVGMNRFKRLLLTMCIREARWVGKRPNSLKLQKVQIEEFKKPVTMG